jgi:putative toxin-antitoxin system antitoxin component (TIGR02293 family)
MAKHVTSIAERPSADLSELWSHVRSGHKEGHYYLSLFGFRNYDPLHAVKEIARGFSYAAFERFLRNTELPTRALLDVVGIPERTLARRKDAGRFNSDESDRLARTSRVFARAIELFEGDASKAREWLMSPAHALGGETPLNFASNDVGAIEVENVIGRLEYGIPS